MDYDKHYKEVYQKHDRQEGPTGWIQWKGTNVCMDLHCECGHHGHLDDSFTYYYECPNCKTLYAVGSVVKLIKLNEENANFVKETRKNVIKTAPLKEVWED